ncbi:MAG: hypothetical protein ACO2PN_20540 [Pyrobaculum sp.]
MLIGPDGSGVIVKLDSYDWVSVGLIVKLDSYDWVSVGPDSLLLDALICSLHVSNDAQLYKPFKRTLIVGNNVTWEGTEKPYTAKELVQTVTQRLADLMLKAAKKLGAQP